MRSPPHRLRGTEKFERSFWSFLLFFFLFPFSPHDFFSLVFMLSFISFVLSGVPWPSPSSRPPSRYQSGPTSLPPRAATPTRPPSRPPSRPSRPPSHPSAHGSPAPASAMPKRMSSEGTKHHRFPFTSFCLSLCFSPPPLVSPSVVFLLLTETMTLCAFRTNRLWLVGRFL